MISLQHRNQGYGLLKGAGLEIGALHEPAPVPTGVGVTYFDAITPEQASVLFPEVPPDRFVKVQAVGDLDVVGLSAFPDASFDFVIINHVLEHLSNPIKTVSEVFRVTKPNGIAIIAIPDKEFTFDRNRKLTEMSHFLADFERGTKVSDDEHYLDFLRSAAPHVFQEPPENLKHHVERARSRREHAHVWNSESFLAFMHESLRRLKVDAELLSSSVGPANQIECFTVWRKKPRKSFFQSLLT